MKGGTGETCSLLQLIDEKKKKIEDKKGEITKRVNYQNEEIMNWIATARQQLLTIPKEAKRPTLYLNRNYLPEELHEKTEEELHHCL